MSTFREKLAAGQRDLVEIIKGKELKKLKGRIAVQRADIMKLQNKLTNIRLRYEEDWTKEKLRMAQAAENGFGTWMDLKRAEIDTLKREIRLKQVGKDDLQIENKTLKASWDALRAENITLKRRMAELEQFGCYVVDKDGHKCGIAKKNEGLQKHNEAYIAIIDEQNEIIKAQGEANVQRHNALCEVKEAVDQYFEPFDAADNAPRPNQK